jgi:predicted GNAT family acetyltransferase
MGMEYTRYEDPYLFGEKVEPYLTQHEDIYSLFFGVLQGIKAGRYENPFMATLTEDGELLAIFQMTPPHPFNIVIVQEERLEEALDVIVSKLISANIAIPSVISLKPWAFRFAEKWKNATGPNFKIGMDQGLYRLDQLAEGLEHSPGVWRYASEDDVPLVVKWYHQFGEDAGLDPSPDEEVQKKVRMFIESGEVFVWEDEGKVVSMMKKARPTAHGITVSMVFTPREERRKGYARTLVYFITEELLKQYDFCVLYTDMLNPTSNKIYQEIGYKKIADSVMLEFTEQ